jgi:hypothetical protein
MTRRNLSLVIPRFQKRTPRSLTALSVPTRQSSRPEICGTAYVSSWHSTAVSFRGGISEAGGRRHNGIRGAVEF